MQRLILVVVAVLFLVSPNFLFLIGVGYDSPSGSQIEKLHPALLLTIALLGLAVLYQMPKRNYLASARKSALWLGGIALSSLVLFSLTSVESGGGEMSGLLVTYLFPALLILLLSHATPSTLRNISLLLSIVFAVNSTIGILESTTGNRLLPFVAGNETYDFDRRSTALLGHPLNNALLTGAWVLIQLMTGLRSGLSVSKLLNVGLSTLAMLAFGGRAALVLMAFLFVFYVYLQLLLGLATGRVGAVMVRTGLFVILAGLATPIAIELGAANAIIERFLFSEGSDDTRFAALQILQAMEPGQWWTGVPISIRTALQATVSSEYGIELAWVALIVTFGLPIAAALLVGMLFTLFSVGRPGGMPAAFLVLYFIATTFTSLSIGGKSLLLAQFLVLLICVASPEVSLAKKQPAASPEPAYT